MQTQTQTRNIQILQRKFPIQYQAVLEKASDIVQQVILIVVEIRVTSWTDLYELPSAGQYDPRTRGRMRDCKVAD
jgi:hypothetical protein